MKNESKRELIINGSLWRVIIVIAAPMMFMNIMTYAYNIIDTILVADIGAMEASAVAITNQIKGVLHAVNVGYSIPCTILLARLIGQNEIEKTKKLSNLLIFIAAAIGLIISILGVIFSQLIMEISQVPQSLISISKVYFTIQILSVGVSVFNAAYLSFEKARGATINIFYINFVQIIIKITLSLLFIKVFNFGINMVALATLISTLVITVFCFTRLFSKTYVFKFSLKNLKFEKKSLKAVKNLSLPIFFGKFIFSSGKVISNAVVVSLGDTAVGALSISNNINAATTTITESMEEVLSVIINQNLGAGKKTRAIQAFYIVLCINIIISFIGVAVCTFQIEHLVSLFANIDSDFYNKIYTILQYERFGIPALGINSAVMGLLYGFGYTKASYILNTARLFLFRIPLLYCFVNFTDIGVKGAGIAMLVSNLAVGIISAVFGAVLLFRIHKTNDVNKLI